MMSSFNTGIHIFWLGSHKFYIVEKCLEVCMKYNIKLVLEPFFILVSNFRKEKKTILKQPLISYMLHIQYKLPKFMQIVKLLFAHQAKPGAAAQAVL